MNNLFYKTNNLFNFYSHHRIGWESLYPSEKIVFEHIPIDKEMKVIDLGCACGGLGVAFKDKFGITDYTGIDINGKCITAARTICPWGNFHSADFLSVADKLPKDYDIACSLSAADWNNATEELLKALFTRLKPGGNLIFSCRITNDSNVKTCFETRQHIVFNDDSPSSKPEYAPYKVYNLQTILQLILDLGKISSIYGYGYWGKIPNSVESIPWDKVFYIVFAITSASVKYVADPRLILDVDANFFINPTF